MRKKHRNQNQKDYETQLKMQGLANDINKIPEDLRFVSKEINEILSGKNKNIKKQRARIFLNNIIHNTNLALNKLEEL